MRRIGIFVFLLTSTAPMAAIAQVAPAPAGTATPAKPRPAPQPAEEGNSDEPDIIVTGSRNLPGSVIGDIQPEEQLGPADIRSYGVSSISDLLNELVPQTTSGRGSGGAPVVLLNGKRISGFNEIRDIPTEAIARVDILPEEVALKYGYRADQKVVNIVLRRRFRATTVELADKVPTAGGRNNAQGEFDLLKIRGDGRFNLHVEYQANSALTENERDISAQPTPNQIETIDQRPYRTLLPSSRDFSTNLVYARSILGGVSATVNGKVEATDSIGLNGLPGVSLTVPAGNPFTTSPTGEVVDRIPGGYLPLHQRNSALNYHLGTTLNGNMGKWRWSVTGNYDRVDSETFTDAGLDVRAFQNRIDAGDPTADPRASLANAGIIAKPGYRAFSTSNNAGVDLLLNGPVFDLPAGALYTSVRVGGDISDLSSKSYREALTQASIKRNTVNGQINVDVPITSRNKHFLDAIGSLSLNFNLAEDHLSDFGTLQTIGYGANWSPIEAIRII
ncbi:MAG: TonB-dependent receptor, partial [Sphingomonas sp.]